MTTFLKNLCAVLVMIACAVDISALNLPIFVDNVDHVTVTTSGGNGRLLDLKTGDNVVEISLDESPLLVAPTPVGKIDEIVCEKGYIMNISGPVEVAFSTEEKIFIRTSPETGMVTVTFSGNQYAFTATTALGENLKIDAFNNVEKGSKIKIAPVDGFRINNVVTQPSSTATKCSDGTWEVIADKNMTINVDAVSDVEGNLMINIDNPSNVVVKTSSGEVLELKAGDNFKTIDRKKESPLKVSATNGAIIIYVASPEMLFPDAEGVYTVELDDSKALSQVYIGTERQQSNTFTVNINKAADVRLTDNYGLEIKLQDGSNTVNFDFSSDNLLHLAAVGDASLRAVAVDEEMQPIVDNKCDFYVYRNSVVDIATGDDGEKGWISIANEDFSGFPAGTNDNPDLSRPLLDQFGNFVNPDFLKPYNEGCTRGWGGSNVYAAGGALAMMDGFLNTPVGDYSGQLRMTFRGRLLPGYGSPSQGIEVLLIRDKKLIDYKRQTYTFTNEWQTFTFEADNGWYNDTRIQFFSAMPAWFEIDDVVIEHKILNIEPPQVSFATEIYNDSFVANWSSTDTADGYLLSVFEHGDSPETHVVDEGFENATVDSDGHIAGLHDGWECNLSANGNRTELNLDSKFAGSGNASICFDAGGDYLVTPVSPYPVSKLTYKLIADDSANAPAQTGAILAVGALTDAGWTQWINQSVNFVANAGGVVLADVSSELGLYDNIYAFRFEAVFPDGDKVRLMIDDIHYEAPAPPARIYLWEDYPVDGQSTTSCKVEDPAFNPEADYFYHVKSRNARYESEPSNESEVYHAHTPEALEATDITDTSFTASWTCGSKADMFDVTLYRTYSVKSDTDRALILDEDFGKVVSTADPSDLQQGEYTEGMVSIDQYTRIPGWSASSYGFSSGAIGGMQSLDGFTVGSVVTPVMDLSNNSGECSVEVRAWLPGGDVLQIQGINQANYASVYWDAPGWKEMRIDMKMCTEEETITFWTGLGKPFVLDYVKIYQDLKAGDKVDIVTNMYRVSDASIRDLMVSGIEQYGDYDFSYDVISRRAYHGDFNDLFTSRRSNRVPVDLAKSGLEQTVASADGLTVISVPGGLEISVSTPGKVGIYSVDGRCMKSFAATDGVTSVALQPGVYVVNSGIRSVKAAVR